MGENDRINNTFLALRATLARVVRRLVPPREIEDIVQETYLRVCECGDDEIRSPRSFMLRTARNLALDHLKRAETRLADSLDSVAEDDWRRHAFDDDTTLENVCSEEEFFHFCNGVRFLPVQCRQAFVLRKVYGYSQQEIARIMRISESTVEKHIATGIKRCLYYLQQQGMDYSGARNEVARTAGQSGGGDCA